MKKVILSGIGIAFFAFVLLFALGRFERVFRGPLIVESSLSPVSEISGAHLIFRGKIKNVNEMLINGRSITLREENSFEETIVVPPGETILEVDVSDIFKHHRIYHYTIISTQKPEPFSKTLSEAKASQQGNDINPEEDLIEHDEPSLDENLVITNE